MQTLYQLVFLSLFFYIIVYARDIHLHTNDLLHEPKGDVNYQNIILEQEKFWDIISVVCVVTIVIMQTSRIYLGSTRIKIPF